MDRLSDRKELGHILAEMNRQMGSLADGVLPFLDGNGLEKSLPQPFELRFRFRNLLRLFPVQAFSAHENPLASHTVYEKFLKGLIIDHPVFQWETVRKMIRNACQHPTFPAVFSATGSPISAACGVVAGVVLASMEKGLLTVAAAACTAVFIAERLMAA